jgi:DNA-binding LacI/PurR family transcriptional regulator
MTVIGVLREACERNICIPDDLSVVGFDDIRPAESTIPYLIKVQISQAKLSKTHKPEGA